MTQLANLRADRHLHLIELPTPLFMVSHTPYLSFIGDGLGAS
jgi:hypothetical protein